MNKINNNTQRRKFTFKPSQTNNDLNYKPDPILFKFYQLCLFANEYTKKHKIRRCILNEHQEFVNIEERDFSERQFKKFIKERRQNEYKIYSTSDIELIDIPNPGDILQAQSTLLNNDYEYTGFATI